MDRYVLDLDSEVEYHNWDIKINQETFIIFTDVSARYLCSPDASEYILSIF